MINSVFGGWTYFALPFGGIGIVVLLLRLGVLNLRTTSRGVDAPWRFDLSNTSPAAVSVPQRLHELENMRASGAISDAEYIAKRQAIISGI